MCGHGGGGKDVAMAGSGQGVAMTGADQGVAMTIGEVVRVWLWQGLAR